MNGMKIVKETESTIIYQKPDGSLDYRFKVKNPKNIITGV